MVALHLTAFYEFIKARQDAEEGTLVVLLDRRHADRRYETANRQGVQRGDEIERPSLCVIGTKRDDRPEREEHQGGRDRSGPDRGGNHDREEQGERERRSRERALADGDRRAQQGRHDRRA